MSRVSFNRGFVALPQVCLVSHEPRFGPDPSKVGDLSGQILGTTNSTQNGSGVRQLN